MRIFAVVNLKIKKGGAMARPIRETPILYGENARRFEEDMKRVESMSLEQRRLNREAARRAYEKLITEVKYSTVGKA